MVRVLIFGGRDFNDAERFHFTLEDFVKANGPITCIIHGKAKGADGWGAFHAREYGIPERPFPAKWDDIHAPGAVIKYTRGPTGKPYNALAGHWRNQEMIDIGKPDWGIGFKGGTGTADMAARLERAEIPIWNGGYK